MREFPVYCPPPDEGLEILFIDNYLMAVNKPSGLLSVPGRGEDKQDSLISRVQLRYPEALIVHRLDMETSGILLLARDKETHRRLSRAFQERQVAKQYLAVVDGCLSESSGEVDLPLICDWPNRPLQKVCLEHGKPSLTRYQRLDYDAARDVSRVALFPVTGRSHQLRVHMLALGHAIVGDPLYACAAAQAKASRLLLHACQLSFLHPYEGCSVNLHTPPQF